ncbi:MAG: hypothetical protein II174_02265 [Erysipelotrichaceae bacterium]|nr:hypothetical protein [Erysipelotrichaceae bacterium]
MFLTNKADKEKLKTFYERNRKRKHSLYSASKEAFIFATVMLLGVIVPVGLTFYYANILGVFWWIILLAYSSLLSSAIYLIYRYREITEIRGYFTDEEFNQRFKKELWLVRFMDKARRFLIH